MSIPPQSPPSPTYLCVVPDPAALTDSQHVVTRPRGDTVGRQFVGTLSGLHVSPPTCLIVAMQNMKCHMNRREHL